MTIGSYTVGLQFELKQNFIRRLGKYTMFAKDNLQTDVSLPQTLYFIAYYLHDLFINSFINEISNFNIKRNYWITSFALKIYSKFNEPWQFFSLPPSFYQEVYLTILYFVPSTILGLPEVKRRDTVPSFIELYF